MSDTDDVFLDLGISKSFGRGFIANNLSLIKGNDPAYVTFDDFHVMFDKQNRDVIFAQRRHHDIHKIELFLDADATGGFVQQQNARFADHRHSDVQKLRMP